MLAGVSIALGLVAEAIGWSRVAAGRADVWRLMPWILGLMGTAAAFVAPWEPADVAAWTAVGVGAASGAVLYFGTRVFVWVAARWEPFRRQTAEKYEEAATVPLARSLALSLAVMVPAEELFWRGLTQATLADPLGVAGGALVAWLLYVAANAPSRSLPIVAGAIVGGGLWVALWWWSGGVLAPLASHILWTGSMLVFPPGAGRGKERT